jgi:2-oxoglutarate ferredoxin oxidoreductase subunit delta
VIMARDRINSKGYHPAAVVEMDKCIGCAFCARMCPDVAIEVEK